MRRWVMPSVGNESQEKVQSIKYAKSSLASEAGLAILTDSSLKTQQPDYLPVSPSLAWQPCPFDLQNFEDVIFHLDSIETKMLLFFHILFCCIVSLPRMVITVAAALKITQIAARNGKWGSVPLSNRSLMVWYVCLKHSISATCSQRQQDN